jgi:hypothetical protein
VEEVEYHSRLSKVGMGRPRARLFATFAFATAAATWLGFITFILFLILRGVFGLINDVSAILLALVQLPVALGARALLRVRFPRLSSAAAILGVSASVMGAIGLGSLVFKPFIPWNFPEPYPGAGAYGLGIIGPGVGGLWQILVGLLSLRSGALPRTVGRLCLLAGIGYVAVWAGFTTGGVSSPVGAVGGLLALIAGPLWLIGLGRKFNSMA